MYFLDFSTHLNVSSQRGMVERLEVFSPPLLCSIHTVVFLIAILFVRFDIDVSGVLLFSIHTVSTMLLNSFLFIWSTFWKSLLPHFRFQWMPFIQLCCKLLYFLCTLIYRCFWCSFTQLALGWCCAILFFMCTLGKFSFLYTLHQPAGNK